MTTPRDNAKGADFPSVKLAKEIAKGEFSYYEKMGGAMTTPTPDERIVKWLRVMSEGPGRAESKKEKHRQAADLIEALQRELAAAQSELASVRGHAEAMAKELETIARSFDRYAALDGNYPEHWNSVRGMVAAYRAAHPRTP